MAVSKLCVSVLLLCYVAAIQATYVGSGPADACGVQCYSDKQCIRSYGNQRCNKCQPVPYNQRFKCCCPANADCTYEDGEYGCECKRGYVQQGYECIRRDPCHSHDCGEYSTCYANEHNYGYTCRCNDGYHSDNGKNCKRRDPCHSHDCGGYSTCYANEHNYGYTCRCNDGYYSDNGKNCKRRDPCHSHDCGAYSTCRANEHNYGYTCTCNKGYYSDNGKNCKLPCAEPCRTNTQCRNWGPFKCNTCQAIAYDPRGRKCCCHRNADCTYKNGKYGCECKRGYVQRGYECVDPCDNHDCGDYSTCIANRGGYTCRCNDGYYSDNGKNCKRPCAEPCNIDRQCKNYGPYKCDKCQAVAYDPRGRKCCCHRNADCTYKNGKYGCECKRGYVQRGYECVDPCDNHDCGDYSTCIANRGGYTCRCNDGYFSDNGKNCKRRDPCHSHDCGEYSTCYANEHNYGYTCRCNDGYYSDNGKNCKRNCGKVCYEDNDCEKCKGHKCDTCQPVKNYANRKCCCHKNAECVYENRRFGCKCKEYYVKRGNDCVHRSCLNSNCHRHAVCRPHLFGNGHSCQCKDNYYGNGYTCTYGGHGKRDCGDGNGHY